MENLLDIQTVKKGVGLINRISTGLILT